MGVVKRDDAESEHMNYIKFHQDTYDIVKIFDNLLFFFFLTISTCGLLSQRLFVSSLLEAEEVRPGTFCSLAHYRPFFSFEWTDTKVWVQGVKAIYWNDVTWGLIFD